MKKFILFTILFCSFNLICAAQKPKTPVKKVEPKTIEPQSIPEISDADWKNLTDVLKAEDWNKSAALAAQYLQNLKADNEKKHLAQLRYIYLYALAGKILAASSVKVPIETDSLWKELDEAVGSFIGKEFVLPPRRFLPECKDVLNYICPVKNNDRLLRVTATNDEGTMIHSFDYVSFDEKISLDKFADTETFLGGRLKRAEFNEDMSKLWVMRLIFEKGFVRVVVSK